MSRRKTTAEFIAEATKVHGEKYDYSKVMYKNNKTKIEIICLKHGSFFQQPEKHLAGQNCRKCAYKNKKNKKTMSKNEFVKNCYLVHGKKYDYSKVVYSVITKKVTIICLEHGEFEQLPVSHLAGRGCPCCAGKSPMKNKKFLREAKKTHGEKYDYSKVDCIDSQTKVTVICRLHGEFYPTPTNHIYGKSGCPECGKERTAAAKRSSTEEFIEKAKKIHDDLYDYSVTEYRKSNVQVEIICKKHGNFSQVPETHLDGSGCPICSESKGEKEVAKYLNKFGAVYERQKKFPDCKNKRNLAFDFYITYPFELLIEYDGTYHFLDENHNRYSADLLKRDSIKNEWVEKKKIDFIRIPYTDFEKIPEIISNLFKEKVA